MKVLARVIVVVMLFTGVGLTVASTANAVRCCADDGTTCCQGACCWADATSCSAAKCPV